MIDQFRGWFDYEKKAHAKVIEAFASVPESNRSSFEYRRAVSILGHIVAARRVWLFRMGLLPTGPTTFFPDPATVDLTAVSTDWDQAARKWDEFLASATDEDLARAFEYKSSDAGRFRNRIEEILTQLFGHSWYHRGQIAMLVKAAGGQPAVTDFIYFCREPIP